MKKVILLSVSILLISLAYAFADVPCKINYQGRLIKDNVPVDGTKTMRFSIHDSAVGGTQLWTSGDVSVEVHNGLFRYVIGSDGGDLSSINWTAGQALYLEVKVEADILTPREELYAYPYAINSHLLEGATKEYFLNISGETQKKDGGLNIIGNVGIGTTSPDRKLHVDGQGITQVQRISSSSNFGTQLEMVNWGTGGRTYSLISTGNSAPEGGGKFVVLDGSTARMTINSTGNVGIGTTDPEAKLHIGGAAGTDGIMFPDGTLQITAGGRGFGVWNDRNKDGNPDTVSYGTTYTAETDGIVVALGYNNAGNMTIKGYTNGILVAATAEFFTPLDRSMTFPVRKGDTWQVTFTYNMTASCTVRWLPTDRK